MRKSLILFLILFTSCFGLFDSDTDNIVDDYVVTWVDLHEQRALFKHEELVAPYVFAVGYNSKFVFAKQHPLLPNSPEKIDKSVVNYYIIERTKNDFQDKPKYGPFTKEEFHKKCSELGISEIEFILEYSTNL